MKNLLQLTFVLVLLNTLTAVAQTSTSRDSLNTLLCKKWKLEKYRDTDSKLYPPLVSMKNDYTKYNPDGTMESNEQGVLIKGNWTLDTDTMTLTTMQTQVKEYPAKITMKVLKLTKTELVLEEVDGGGSVLTLYMKPVINK